MNFEDTFVELLFYKIKNKKCETFSWNICPSGGDVFFGKKSIKRNVIFLKSKEESFFLM